MSRLVFEDVTVDIPIYDIKSRSLKHRMILSKVSTLIARKEHGVGGSVIEDQRGVVIVRALDGVSFAAEDGDRIAIVGHNGAGKTTLLRVAAGIYEPTGGSVMLKGRVMPLFNIMEGMAPDATGIEMIHTRGTLLGMTQKEIREKADDIIEFCDLGDYIQMPVRTYSSGMLMRLAFAITTAVESEVLIMDEVIGTGDAAFFERAERRMQEFVARSNVLLVATHSPDIVKKWCNKAMLFQHGKLVEAGPVDAVLATYARHVAA
jgi:ABC-2 type transport system ATP-binding protein/lipopolysaccharide transport system ATP-binding protein